MSHGAGPGESIMIVLGLPVVLFGVMPTIIGFTKFPEEKKPDVPELGLEQSPKNAIVFLLSKVLYFSGLGRARESCSGAESACTT